MNSVKNIFLQFLEISFVIFYLAGKNRFRKILKLPGRDTLDKKNYFNYKNFDLFVFWEPERP